MSLIFSLWHGIETYLNPVQNAGVEHVDTSVDPVTNEFDGLLDESVNHGRVGLGDHDTVSRRLGDLGDHDGTFTLVGKVEVSAEIIRLSVRGQRITQIIPKGLKGIDTGDIRVQNEEWRVVLAQDIPSKGKGTSFGVRQSGRRLHIVLFTHQYQGARFRR